MDEHEAIRRMKQGDINGLAVLVNRYQTRAVRVATLITRDQSLAEDVVQATFIRIYKKIDQFDTTRPFAPWFMRSVVNGALQTMRKQQPLSLHAPAGDDVTFEELLVDGNPSPDTLLESDENTQLVRDALDQLSPEQRAAVVMRYYLDMSESDMAEALDTPKGTVKWRLHAARRQLKRLLGGVLKPIGWEAKNG